MFWILYYMEKKVKILFWNLKKNANENWITELINEYSIDIAIFSEYSETSFDDILVKIGQEYMRVDGYGACEKITLICRRSISLSVSREQNRYTLYSFDYGKEKYNIAGIHLPAPPASDSNDRKYVIRNLVCDLTELEKKQKNNNTIVIGDFNCNPFDEEIIQRDTFNAVLFKKLIEKQENITYQSKKYRRFYSPVLDYLSESTETYGSFYYSSGSAPLFWNSFDQVLVRKALVNRLKDLKYCKTINGKSLLKDIKPNSAISDHLPLIVEIEED